MNEILINQLLSVPVGGVNSRLCYEAATEIQRLKAGRATIDMQKEYLAKVSEVIEFQEKQHQENIARRDDEQLDYFAAAAMNGMLANGLRNRETIANYSYQQAQAMLDYKKNMKEAPQYQAPAVLGGGVLGGAQQQQGDFNYMRDSWDCSFCNTKNDRLFSLCFICGQLR